MFECLRRLLNINRHILKTESCTVIAWKYWKSMSRDILAPPLLQIGKRSYRVNEIHEDFGGNTKVCNIQEYTEEDMYRDDDYGTENYEIEECPNAMYKTSLHIPQPFYGGLIGYKGATKRRIESETQTEIFIPRQREVADVSIKGKSRSNVCSARRKIELLVISLRNKMRATHFTCIPTCKGTIRKRFEELQEQILSDNYPGIEKELFQSADRIHITLGICVLLDDEDRTKAAELLHDCKKFLAEIKTPIEVKISRLEIMNDDPSAVRVLYACIESPDLLSFANQVNELFIESNLGIQEKRNIKLHMTVMNIKHLEGKDVQCSKTFDARGILKKYGDYDFGVMQANEVHLSIMHKLSPTTNEFYKSTAILQISNSEQANK